MTKYEKDKIVVGYVTGVEKYGIFVSLDNYYSGLIHISEVSTKYVKNINSYAYVGENIKVRILDLDKEKKHAKLSIKDINYRFKDNNNITYIEETPKGFTTLKGKIPKWVEEKLREYKNI